MSEQLPNNIAIEQAHAAILEDAFARFSDASTKLQERYDALTAEVSILQAQLKEKDEEVKRHERLSMLGETAAAIAHEVRNPLGAIKLFLSLLRGDVTGNTSATKLVDQIDGSISSLDHVVSNILHFAKSSVGPLAPVNMHSLIQEILSQTAALHRGKVGVRLNLLAEPFVMADEHGLRQVLRNLFMNALQAMRYEGTLEVKTRNQDEALLLEVSDTGPGIPASILPRLCEPFVTGRKEGTGLGLAISKRIVTSLGGTIVGENMDEGGAMLKVVLPRKGF